MKRQQPAPPAVPAVPVDPVAPEPIFLSSHPSPAHVKSLQPLKHAPARAPGPVPFTAFPASPAPSLLPRLHHPDTTVAPPVTPPPPSPTPPLVQFSKPVKHFASFAPVKSLPPPPPPAPLVHHPVPSPAPHHPPPAPLVHHAPPAPLVHAPPPPAPVHHEDLYEPSPEDYEPKPYSYNFGVNDVYSGVDYNRAEERSDTGVTRGSYTVKLPDGRIQTVSYVADDNGFHATVSYEGEPAYPEVKEVLHPAPHPAHPVAPVVSEPVYKPSNRYRASNKVAVTPETTFISPTPAPLLRHPTPAPVVHHQPAPVVPVVKAAPVAPVVKAAPAPLVKDAPAPVIGPVVKQLPHSPPTTPLPTLYTPTTTYSPPPAYHSPFPNFSPSPAPYFHASPTPPPYGYGSPSPLPHLETSTPAPYDVTPAPIFHTSPSLILGLKASHPPDHIHYDVAATNYHHAPVVKPHYQDLDITTWKPKYPKILEHTLRSAPSETYYGHRIKVKYCCFRIEINFVCFQKGVKEEDEVTKKDDYDEYEY